MNTLILGLPRNGKGLYSCQLAIDELVKGTRPIVGNFAFEKAPWATKKHELRAGLLSYLDRVHGDTFNAAERIFRLTDDATAKFYLYRPLSSKQVRKLEAAGSHLVGYREVLPADNILAESEWQFHRDMKLYVCDHVLDKDKKGRDVLVSFNAALLEHSGGCMNIADECWKFWAARSWQSTSECDVFYNAQHGKFGDDNLFVTHRHNDIDSVIVDRCQESVVLTHHGKMTWGRFRRPDVFTAATYSGRPMPSKEPMSTRTFRLDAAGLGACYDTSAGVGVTGRGDADRNSRKRGLPFWIIPVLGVLAVCLLLVGWHFGTAWIHSKITGSKHPVPAQVTKIEKPKEIPVPAAAQTPVAANTDISDYGTNDVVCLGWCCVAGNYLVFTDDGETYESKLHEIDWIKPHEVSILGRRLRIVHVNPAVIPVRSNYERLDQPPVAELPPVLSEGPASTASVIVIGQSWNERRNQNHNYPQHLQKNVLSNGN